MGVFREESGAIGRKRNSRTESTMHRLYYRNSRFMFHLVIEMVAFNNQEERHKTASNRLDVPLLGSFLDLLSAVNGLAATTSLGVRRECRLHNREQRLEYHIFSYFLAH